MPAAAPLTEDRAAGIAFWRRPGPGRVLVCLHGIGSNAGSFRPMLDHLPAGWDVIAWNAPGYGGSEALTAEWPTEADYAAALGRFLDVLGLGAVTLLGHSLGTLMAARFAADAPERVDTLILAASACGHGKVPGDLSEAAAARIAAIDLKGARAVAEDRGPRLLADPEGRPEAKARVVDAMAQVTMPGYGQAVKMLASGRLVDSLSRVTAPAMVIWGTGDIITPRAQSEAAAAALGTEIHEIPGSGHACHVETPAEFAAALRASPEPTAPRKKESVQ
ncbi:alpha/beta fold hydrolase [Mesobacterium pallidum]|uniref:alpha/beta fold hydrolase n=1 Tax=Mesobacterium pallidum TaxID=2872037 RepID=UPI001EE271CF|nr:alpha/beta hydrolase [Mesobacterium pallidum]